MKGVCFGAVPHWKEIGKSHNECFSCWLGSSSLIVVVCYHIDTHQLPGVGPPGPQVLLTCFEMLPHVGSVTSTIGVGDEVKLAFLHFTFFLLVGPYTDSLTRATHLPGLDIGTVDILLSWCICLEICQLYLQVVAQVWKGLVSCRWTSSQMSSKDIFHLWPSLAELDSTGPGHD